MSLFSYIDVMVAFMLIYRVDIHDQGDSIMTNLVKDPISKRIFNE